MKEHANSSPTGFKDIADYIIIDGEIFFSPSIFGERKSPEIIDLFLNTLLDFLLSSVLKKLSPCKRSEPL